MLSSIRRRIFRSKPDHDRTTNGVPASDFRAPGASAPEAPSEPQPRRAKSFFYSGIKTLHSSQDDKIDIVFIHGLNGDCEKTWTAKTEIQPWPKVFLPPELPNCRVLTYGYDAGVVDSSKNRVSDHAYTLLTSLASCRQSAETAERPIIFVCHSLGGLVCQDALVAAKQRPEAHLQKIFHLTRGIVFLGTPHHGSSLAKWGEMLSRSVGMMKQTNTEIVRLLTRDSEVLARIQDCFHTLIMARNKEETNNIEITCFYEELPMKRIGVVVPKHSATLPGYISIGIHSNHAQMTKFGSRAEPGFVAVCGELKRWVKKIEQQGPTESKSHHPGQVTEAVPHYLIPYTSNPDFVGRSDVIESLKDQLGHAESTPRNKAHLRASLCGLGGVGKTQVALAYAYWLQEAHPEISLFWVHANSAERFVHSYANIAEECHIPGYDESSGLDSLSVVKSWLESKDSGKWLMIIDNADDMQLFFPSGDGEKFSDYIPECAHGTALITTRNLQVGSRLTRGKRPIEVNKMDEDESVQLLIRGLQGIDEDPIDLLRLSSRLEFLPLALVQASAFIQENTITVDKYLELLDGSEKGLVDLLSEDFEAAGRDSATPRAVTETWILSFQQIERQYPFAAELLSLMSLFDRQSIPMDFLEFYSEEKEKKPNSAIQLVKALGILKAFSFIIAEKRGDHNMHRLVQLVTRAWLNRNGTKNEFTRWALLAVSDSYPYGHFEDISTCSAYLAHAYAVLDSDDIDSQTEPKRTDSETEGKLVKASLRHRVGGFFLFQGRYAEAERLQRQAINTRTELLGAEHPETLTVMSDLAAALCNQGQWEEAEELEVHIMETRKRLHGEEHEQSLDAMNNLAFTIFEQGRLEEAGKLWSRVLEIRKRALGEDHLDTILAMNNLATTLGGEAEKELQRRVIETRKRLLGEEHPDTLISMGNLAMTLYENGETWEAEELQVQVLEVSKRVLGEEHPDTLIAMTNLGRTWTLLGKLSADTRHLYPDVDMLGDALALLQECVRLRRQVLGEDHPDTQESCECLEECRVALNAEATQQNSQVEVQFAELPDKTDD
ncbi:DUF676 domain-containing protein [Fusarium falciforme]|uniref:DUF676 domain-containing protein n=1 Tax=Fusarium falciforme TaxID=195108 RepID=UPI0023016096|nr:DUF676 domain-containing protein [Fusarium falciforme]WAO93126.1 DUF676 domain-containing protein [Fusarium falciforme]